MDFVKRLSIGTRLGLGFAVVLVMMVAMSMLAFVRFSMVETASQEFQTKEWVKAEAAYTVDGLTRANARNTMELFIGDPAQLSAVRRRIEDNKRTISEALAVLDGLVYTEKGKNLLTGIKDGRAKYVASFTRVDDLLQANRKEEAQSVLRTQTLPALDALQEDIAKLVELQTQLVTARGSQISSDINAARWTLLALGALAVAAGAAFAWWLTRSIVGPIQRAVRVAEDIAAGHIGQDVEVQTQAGKDECERLLQSLRAMNLKLSEIVSSVTSGANNVGSAAHQLAQGNDDLSRRTQEQASALEETAATMEELTATVKRNSDNAQQADRLVRQAREQADNSNGVVEQTIGAMDEINHSSRKIADIINVIDEIAFQTNLLALNAAVEAARAGEQGRGFAVVASEVRNLAQRSASAAKEIKHLINDSVDKVRAGSELVNASGQTLKDIAAGVRRIAEVVAEIASAGVEQAAGIDQINVATTQMDSTTQQNAALVEEAASASKSMEDQARDLIKLMSFFQVPGMVKSPAAQQIRSATVTPIMPATASVQPRERQSAPLRVKAAGSDVNWTEF